MNLLKNTAKYLSTNQSIEYSAFTAGFVWSLPAAKTIVTNPLSTMFVGSIGGYVTVMCAQFVTDMLPNNNIKCGLSIALITSSIFYGYNSLKNKPIEN